MNIKELARKIESALCDAGYNGGTAKATATGITIQLSYDEPAKTYDAIEAERLLASLIEQTAGC